MNTYRPHTPRIALALGAVALTVATIGVSVIAPSRMDFRSQQVAMLAVSQTATLAAGDAARVDSIDVVATREPHMVTVVQSRRVERG